MRIIGLDVHRSFAEEDCQEFCAGANNDES